MEVRGGDSGVDIPCSRHEKQATSSLEIDDTVPQTMDQPHDDLMAGRGAKPKLHHVFACR